MYGRRTVYFLALCLVTARIPGRLTSTNTTIKGLLIRNHVKEPGHGAN